MSRSLVAVVLLVVLGLTHAIMQVRYDGHQLVDVQIQTEEQIKLVEALGLDVWTREGVVGLGSNHLLVPPPLNEEDADALSVLADLAPNVLIEDVQTLIDNQHDTDGKDAAGFFDAYHDFEEIVAETKALADKFPSVATFVPSIGSSIQGRVSIFVHWLIS